MEWIPKTSQHRNLTLENNILPLLLLGFELTTFQSRVQCAPNTLSWLLHYATFEKRFIHVYLLDSVTHLGGGEYPRPVVIRVVLTGAAVILAGGWTIWSIALPGLNEMFHTFRGDILF